MLDKSLKLYYISFMSARKRSGTRLIPIPDSWRDKIRVGNIMTRLEKGFNGEVELTTEQINAAKLLLSKVVPDLARTELTGKEGGAIEYKPVGSLVDNMPSDMRKKLIALMDEEQ